MGFKTQIRNLDDARNRDAPQNEERKDDTDAVLSFPSPTPVSSGGSQLLAPPLSGRQDPISHPVVPSSRSTGMYPLEVVMPLYMDVHDHVEGLTAEAVADAHKKDLETQKKHGVVYHRYWYDTESGKVFCLVEAPSKEAAEQVHREAHGLVADHIYEVNEGS